LKSCDGNEKSVQRLPSIIQSPGRHWALCQHLQVQRHADSQFRGEPLHVAVDEDDPINTPPGLESPNEDNKVSLFVRAIDLATQTYKDVIITNTKQWRDNR